MSTILKKLEISGFKSFGKRVTLEFDSPVTAIVGPNGSGKSNVSEAIRWVLGEQSMKSLRGKRGEDLIFHGSNNASRLGKARVSITFDNAGQIFPVDFSELEISREVFRDGTNEYRVNDTHVRLKDVIDLMSNVGVGGSGHHIISQGEADRVLYASPKDRKIMIEDALGLRVYHSKQAETERKLAATEENMREVAMLRREIQPHMKFLKGETVKIEASQKLREELSEALRAYINREHASLEKEKRAFFEQERPLQDTLKNAEREAERLRSELRIQQADAEANRPQDIADAEKRLSALEEERRNLERDVGRMEGWLTALQQQTARAPEGVALSASEIEKELRALLAIISETENADDIATVRRELMRIKEHVARLLTRATKKEIEAGEGEERALLEEERENLLHRLGLGEEEKTILLEKIRSWEEKKRALQAGLYEAGTALRAAETRVFSAKDALRALELTREHIRMRSAEFSADCAEAEPITGSITAQEAEPWTDDQRKKAKYAVQRMRIKLEEAGGINPAVVREYEEVQTRDAFLFRELQDLEKTSESLRSLSVELEKNLRQKFSDGITKINAKFTELFEAMFGGGSAKLEIIRLRAISDNSAEDSTKQKEEYGIEVAVDIPRKRVKNLDMLSGGERALASIALLFAVSFVNPPPFLALDETDAALDEANSRRYGAMLRNLAEKTQLIVITHNRQTMKEAGVLYGVTMGADGVSRLLSLKFEEAAQVSEPVKH